MGKFLLFLLLVLGVVLYVRAQSRRVRPPDAPPPPDARMVRCARCGVFHPEAESVIVDGQNFCSTEHSRERQ